MTPDNRALWELVERCIFSKDLYAVLMDVQNGIYSPALPAMANRAIIHVDQARAILERPVVIEENQIGDICEKAAKSYLAGTYTFSEFDKENQHMCRHFVREAIESIARCKS